MLPVGVSGEPTFRKKTKLDVRDVTVGARNDARRKGAFATGHPQ